MRSYGDFRSSQSPSIDCIIVFTGARFIHINEVIKYNDRESMKAAVKDGLDLDQKDKFYKTPLMMACLEGNLQMARYLISHGFAIYLSLHKILRFSK